MMKRFVSGLVLVAALALAGVAEGQTKTVAIDHFGCKDPALYSSILTMILQGDERAATRALASEAMIGRCAFFDANERVYMADVAVWGGLVKIRKIGQPAEFWTGIRMVR